MITVAPEAIAAAVGTVGENEKLLDYGAVTESNVDSVKLKMDRNNDEVFVRLALEQTMKDGRWQDYANFSGQFEEELEPVILDLYNKIWGPLPDGPAPKIKYVRCWTPRTPSFNRQDWFDLRESLYGPPPYDYEKLRAISLEP